MFLERLLFDGPFPLCLDTKPTNVNLVLSKDLRIIEVTGQWRILAGLVPGQGQAEELAEEILARAASMNKPVSEAEARKRYWNVLDLDLGEGHVIQIRGRAVMIPDPEFLGRYQADDEGNIAMAIHNVQAVLPIE
jgi:hypothetical protein